LWAIATGFEDASFEPEVGGRDREHPAKLAAAEDAITAPG